MEYLEVLPALSEISGSRKCYLGPTLMEKKNVKIGQSVRIQTDCCSFLCSAWPRNDKLEGYIQFDPSVVCAPQGSERKYCGKCLTGTNKLVQSHLLTENVSKFESKTLSAVSVDVVFEDYRDVTKYKKLLESEMLKRKVFTILRKSVVSKGSVVRCNRMKLGKLHNICYIIINHCTGKNNNGAVTVDTKISVANITSNNRFAQKIASSGGSRNVGGLDRERAVLLEALTLPYKYPDARQKFGVQFARGILLRGPPGCGKTCLVRSVTAEIEAYLEYVNGADICGGRPGEGEEKLRNLFDKALNISEDGTCVLFIDEIDALSPQKGTKGSGGQERRLVSQLTALLDTVHEKGNLVVVGATNRPQALDLALRRPGRFDKEIFIGIPKYEQRHDILKVLTQDVHLGPDVSIDKLAEATPGYTGADLASIFHQATFDAYINAEKKDDFCLSKSYLDKALHNTVPSTQRGSDILVDYRPVYWDNIGGLETVKQQLKQAVEWPLKHPDAFQRLGVPPPSGVLLYGPPGCAKTTLVRAAATACHVTFLAISGAQLFSPFVGDSEKKLSEAFQQARAGAPSILFIDEIESLVGKRSHGNKTRGAQERVLSTLLNEMDGIGIKTEDLQQQQSETKERTAEGESLRKMSEPETCTVENNDVLLVAATNRPDMIDDALLRPGRIDRLIFVPLPDQQARQKILEVYTKNIPVEDVSIEQLAALTEGYTGADLENLCREAALHAMTVDGIDTNSVHHKHFLHCLETVKPSLTKEEVDMYSKLLRK